METDGRIEDAFLSRMPSNHRIKYSFQKMNSGYSMQNEMRKLPYNDGEIERLRKQIFKEELKEDNPVILINPDFMDWVNARNQERMTILSGMLAHELRHVCEQYVLEFQNVMLTSRGSLNYDFKHNNVFSLDTNSELYKKLGKIMYYMSREEQRARI